MKKNKNILLCITVALLILFTVCINSSLKNVNAAQLESEDYYQLLATAINLTDTNTFEDNRNPQMFDYSSDYFKTSISARIDYDTYASSFSSTSAYEFSNKYSQTFSTEIDSSMKINASIAEVNTDISAKFDTAVNSESWSQKSESYEYYYWYVQKYSVNIDWQDENIKNALSNSFKRDLSNVDSVIKAKELLKKYGSHVYDTYVLGGKLEITKYYAQDASYTLSETEKNVSASLDMIVKSANSEAKVSGSVDLSQYETNSASSSSVYSKLGFHGYGGNSLGAVSASDLFQYKTQYGTGSASGFLYEAWMNSFNSDNISLKIVKASNQRAIWDILDSSTYSSQISLLKKAYSNMAYESYANKCSDLDISCNYFDSIEYKTNNSTISFTPNSNKISVPENSNVLINLSDIIEEELDTQDYQLNLSSSDYASISDNRLIINNGTKGNKFSIELLIEGIKAYTLEVSIDNGKYSGGYGTSQQPYLISSKNDFFNFIQNISGSSNHFKLISDIDLEGEKIDTGGSGTYSSFKGTFDGDMHTIKNCTIRASIVNNGYTYVGLFGKNEGTIKNIILNNVKVLSGLLKINNMNVTLSCGILTGYNSGLIYNCQVNNCAIRISADITYDSSTLNIGGISGYSDGNIEYSDFVDGYIYGIVTNGSGKVNVGGIAGELLGATISKSYVAASKINIYNSTNSTYTLGGLVGLMSSKVCEDKTNSSSLNICLVYDVNLNKSDSNVGYIAGNESNSIFISCYYKANKELSVNGGPANNCKRVDKIEVNSLPSSFEDFIDGQAGPILKIHAI